MEASLVGNVSKHLQLLICMHMYVFTYKFTLDI